MSDPVFFDSKHPELMSPAGGWPQLEAAVRAGADAVYFGLHHFSARAKVGFSLDELPSVIRQLHRHGVKGFVTFNTLIFNHELAQAEQAIASIAEAGANAIIVQDVGVADLARRIAPSLDIHGSTQMSITSAEGADWAKSLGCRRVVLGRELDLANIRKIAAASQVELEVFVHGALCVSYSGQCFSSEAWGGRSANRGQCAQACRLSYDLIVDESVRDLGEFRYLLSPGDLYAVKQVPELVEIGIACLKIEGRYKDADYVELTTRAYRHAIDAAIGKTTPMDADAVSQLDLEQVYSRGLGPHFLSGIDHQAVVNGRAPRHRGPKVGTVTEVWDSAIEVELDLPIYPGDGVVFDAAAWRSPDEREEGGNVYFVEKTSEGRARLEFARDAIDFNRIRGGDWVWRTHDPKLVKKIKRERRLHQATSALSFEVWAELQRPLHIVATTAQGETATFVDDEPLVAAEKKPLNTTTLENQLGRLGNTPFHVQNVRLHQSENVFCSLTRLNHARRNLVEQLMRQRETKKPVPIFPQVHHELERRRQPVRIPKGAEASKLSLHLLVRNAQQLEAAIDCRPASITLDYLELYGLRPSVERVRTSGIDVRVASPRILKPSEQNIVRFLLSLDCQILIRSSGLLHDLVTRYSDRASGLPPIFGDFSLNVSNAISLARYLDLGLDRISPTHDLNGEQIAELTQFADAGKMEVIAFHHLPVFHTEHCVFCRFLSTGTDSSNCGHPCEKHQIALKDNRGRRHPVLADVGCRNTVFGAEAQTATRHLKMWIGAGIQHFRLEFVHQEAETVRAIAETFQRFLQAPSSTLELERALRQWAPEGTTEGSLFVPEDYKNLVQLK